MKASIVDLRYQMNDVLKALDRREEVTILYHGKAKGKIVPIDKRKKKLKVQNHPFFGRLAGEKEPVEKVMERLRGGRFRDL